MRGKQVSAGSSHLKSSEEEAPWSKQMEHENSARLIKNVSFDCEERGARLVNDGVYQLEFKLGKNTPSVGWFGFLFFIFLACLSLPVTLLFFIFFSFQLSTRPSSLRLRPSTQPLCALQPHATADHG